MDVRFWSGILLALLPLFTAAQTTPTTARETVDRIVVVVGNEIITATELSSQMQLTALRTRTQPRTPEEVEALQQRVLDAMISDKLLQFEAKQDTSLSIRPEEIDQQLDNEIARIAQNYGSNDAFVDALAAEGLTLRDLKKQYRSEIENQLYRERYLRRRLSSVSVSKKEVESFFSTYKDSLAGQAEALKLAHLLCRISPSRQVEDSVRTLALQVREQILSGSDFATLAIKYSSFGAGANGGDLGYVAREDLVPEFARAAFSLAKGEVSGAVRTQFGYHLIRNEGARDDKLRLRHILFAVEASAADTIATSRLADSLLSLAQNGSDFAELAKSFSADDDSRAKGGEMGWFALADLPVEFGDALKGWSEVGGYRGPIASQYGFHIVKLLDFRAARTFTLEADFDQIKDMARQHKTQQSIETWLAEIRAKTFIEYRLES